MTHPGRDSRQFYAAMQDQTEFLRTQSGCAFGQLAGDLMACLLSYAEHITDTGTSPTPALMHQDLQDCLVAFGDRVAADPTTVHPASAAARRVANRTGSEADRAAKLAARQKKRGRP